MKEKVTQTKFFPREQTDKKSHVPFTLTARYLLCEVCVDVPSVTTSGSCVDTSDSIFFQDYKQTNNVEFSPLTLTARYLSWEVRVDVPSMTMSGSCVNASDSISFQ